MTCSSARWRHTCPPRSWSSSTCAFVLAAKRRPRPNQATGKVTTPLTFPSPFTQRRAVSREIVFYSAKCINDFRLTQKLIFGGVAIEEWEFRFGFVIAGSRNSWQQQIEAAAQMLEPEALSGNLVIETSFYDGATFLCKNLVRIHYV
mmetsp:Transcript_23166/g.72266  ORF Transcript_23166/g.72266 Transcript_23166/m.72266 type:complete len:147 (+) Transcript_23166:905-1345(+)